MRSFQAITKNISSVFDRKTHVSIMATIHVYRNPHQPIKIEGLREGLQNDVFVSTQTLSDHI